MQSNHYFKDEIDRLNKYIGILSSSTEHATFESDFNSTGKEKLNRTLQLREVLVNSGSLNKINREILEQRIKDMLSNTDSDQLKVILESMKAKIYP